MYEFPPQSWIASSWRPMAIHIMTMLSTFGFYVWIIRSKRKAKLLDLAAVVVVTLVATFFLVGPKDSYGYFSNSANGVFFLVLWIGAIVPSLYCLKELADREGEPSSIETLVMFAVIAVVLALLIPPFQRSPEAYRRMACRNNLKQIALSLHNFHDVHESFPMSHSGRPAHSWRVDILPFMDQSAVYEDYDFNTVWNKGKNDDLARREARDYRCPSDDFERSPDDYFFTAYAAVTGEETMWKPYEPLQIKEIIDGTSNTLMVVEACGQRIPWSEPRDLPLADVPIGINLPGDQPGRSNGLMSSYHYGGVQVALADGSIRYLSAATDPDVLKGMFTPAGSEPPPDF